VHGGIIFGEAYSTSSLLDYREMNYFALDIRKEWLYLV